MQKNQPTATLSPLPGGRIFCRSNEGTGFVGLVEMPASIPTECMRQFRCNTQLWVDAQHSRAASTRSGDQDLKTHTANELLLNLDFSQNSLDDALECFVRRSFLPHSDPNMAWNIVLSAKRTPSLHMPQDGLYEFSNGQPRLVSRETYNGYNLGQVLQQPLWGPEGQFALTSSMEPAAYHAWIGPEQERTTAKDPLFKAFVLAMQSLGDVPMYMTQAQLDTRDAQSKEVIQTLLNDPDSLLP